MSFKPDPNLADDHRRWLDGFDPQYARNWDKLLTSDPEAAMCEAAVRHILQDNGNAVEPSESLTGSGQSPDFRCSQAGKTFYVEATCISIEKATEQTALSHLRRRSDEGTSYSPLNDAIFIACKQKTRQCSELDSPALVAVGTHHIQASDICLDSFHLEDLLTGEPMIARNVDTSTGDPEGETYEITHLHSATFLRPDQSSGMSHARNPVSGLLLCGLGSDPPQVHGLLHPDPLRPFDRSLLPKVKFCRLRAGYESGQLSTEWI